MAERNTDTVPAMLTPGEFVITDKAVKNAGGPGFFYWLMNALDPGSKKPKEDGYQYGGTVLSSLLSRTKNKNNNYKNVAAELENVLPREDLMNMVQGSGTLQMGKGGIQAILSANKDDILKMLSKMRTTGKGSKEIAKNVDWQTTLKQLKNQATSRRFTNPIKKQLGGSVGDYSLTGLLMPTMDKRLGKPLMKFEHGGTVPAAGEPGYYHYLQEQGQAGQTQAPPPGTSGTYQTTTPPIGDSQQQGGGGARSNTQQGMLIQPSTSTSTGIESIFQEMGFRTPGEEYLSTVQSYDPTQQNRLREKMGRGMSGVEKSSFAGSGAERRNIGQQRDLLTEQYQMGAGDYRKQYRADIMAGALEDLTEGTYDFQDLA